MASPLRLLRRLTPKPVFAAYHYALAVLADWRFGRPSRQLAVIGITGTKGKTTTAILAHHLLTEAGLRAGLSSSVSQAVGKVLRVNRSKMTTLGRGRLHRLMREMLDAGCTHAVIETSSEAVKQSRHVGVRYDTFVLTNLTPEHIESHGSFEAYRDAKAALFAYTAQLPRKRLHGREVSRTRVLPAEGISPDDLAPFLKPDFPETFWVSATDIPEAHTKTAVIARTIQEIDGRPSFDITVDGESFPVSLKMLGRFNVANALAAATAVHTLGIPWDVLARGLSSFPGVAGRMELIQEQPFRVLVDYAHEPASYAVALSAARHITQGRLIAVVGSAGGSRDTSRRPLLGKLTTEHADVVVVTDEDPYDTDPMEIIRQVADGAVAGGAKEGERLQIFRDRREGIRFAIHTARPGDTVLLLGKGAEPVMAVAGGKLIPWDDRQVAREELAAL